MDTNFAAKLEGWIREFYSFAEPVIALPHLAFRRDIWALEQVANVTGSKPALWPLYSPMEKNLGSPNGPDIEKWAMPESQNGLFKECIPSPIFCTNEYIIVDSVIGNTTIRRVLPPEVIAPSDYLQYDQIPDDWEARHWNAVFNNIDQLQWAIMRCGYDNDQYFFLCSPKRSDLVEKLRLLFDRKFIDYLELKVQRNTMNGRGIFLGIPFDQNYVFE